ncbi:MAG TPA: NAD-dependent epimerase/dehydratase family protein [Polyangiaceae bacterium]|nr:NAD-dependent epimerase/dehydratase family protein [Polyangiaceae bacterium]
MRVLVTGGAGFIGSHVVAQALSGGHEPSVLDNFSTGKRENVPPGVRVFECDLRDREATARAIREARPDVVSHQAAQASVPVSMKDPRLDAEVNLLGGLNLLEACRASQVKHVVFASTGGAIYGEVPEGERADESSPCRPQSPYGIHKLAFEQLLGVYASAYGLKSSVLRYANVYGPRQDPHGEAGVVAIFFNQARAGRPLQIFSRRASKDGGCVRDYTFVADVARANLLAMTGAVPHPLLNVASGQPTTTLELAQQILALTGSTSPLVHAAPRLGDIERSLLASQRFEQTLGTPTPLAVGLAETARYYLEQ